MKNNKREKRITRHRRVRAKAFGTAKRPRLSVFRSNKNIYAQLVDDENSRTLASASSLKLKLKKANPKDAAYKVGENLAQKAKAAGVKKIVFDRGGYKFHGRVSEFAKGAKDGGLEF